MTSLADTTSTIPQGIPQGLTVRDVAKVLRLREATVKTALKSGALSFWQISEGRRWRYSTPEAVLEFAQRIGLKVYWDELSTW